MIISEFFEFYFNNKEIDNSKKEEMTNISKKSLKSAFKNLKDELEEAKTISKKQLKTKLKAEANSKIQTFMLNSFFENFTKSKKIIDKILSLFNSIKMKRFLQICSVLNIFVIFFMIETMNYTFGKILKMTDIILDLIFLFEIFLILLMFGVKRTWSFSYYSKFDLMIFISIIILITVEIKEEIYLIPLGSKYRSFLYGLKVLRPIRFMKRSRFNYFRSIYKFSIEIMKSLANLWDFLLVICVLIFISTIIGIELLKRDHHENHLV